MKYDPNAHIDPEEWKSTDEMERQILVEDAHKKLDIEFPSLRAHAAIHVIVENQIAMGDEVPARETLDRLMAEGLDRHDAVHAIGTVLSSHMYPMLKGKTKQDFDPEKYRRDLEKLTAESWLSGNVPD